MEKEEFLHLLSQPCGCGKEDFDDSCQYCVFCMSKDCPLWK